jgi:hypothetical protein
MAPAKGRARAEGRGSTPWLVAGGAAAMQRKQQMSKGCRVSEGRRDGYRSSPKSMEWRWVRLLGGDGRRLVSIVSVFRRREQQRAAPARRMPHPDHSNHQTAKPPNRQITKCARMSRVPRANGLPQDSRREMPASELHPAARLRGPGRARAVPAVGLTAAGVCLEVSVSSSTAVTGSAFTVTSCTCTRHAT